MQTRTSTLVILAYGIIAVAVLSLVYFSSSQYRKTEQLISKLNEVNEQQIRERSASETPVRPRTSMRPSLVRLQRLLEERTQLVREQQSQLKRQMQGREKLQEENSKLAADYDALLSDHDLLLNEVEFYLGAAQILSEQESTTEGEDAEGSASPAANGDAAAGEGASAATDAAILDLANLELTRLREELAETQAALQRDALIASFASHMVIEMGPTALPLLSDVLADNNPEARVWAAWVLGQMGLDAAPARADLARLLDHEDARVAAAAADALAKIGDSR